MLYALALSFVCRNWILLLTLRFCYWRDVMRSTMEGWQRHQSPVVIIWTRSEERKKRTVNIYREKQQAFYHNIYMGPLFRVCCPPSLPGIGWLKSHPWLEEDIVVYEVILLVLLLFYILILGVYWNFIPEKKQQHQQLLIIMITNKQQILDHHTSLSWEAE